MIYLLAKFALILLLATTLGIALGYWWSRRNFVDVSESYDDLRRATGDDSARWSELWSRLDSLPKPAETDLTPVVQRLDGLNKTVDNLVDLAPVERELAAINQKIGELSNVEIHGPVDLQPMARRIDALMQRVDSLPQPEKVDLEPMATNVEALRRRIERMPVPLPVDLQPVAHKMDAIEKRLDNLPQPEQVDMTPIYSRILKIENDIARIRQHVSQPAHAIGAERQLAETEPKRSEPKILSAALYGKKDDLKKISGVGPKLERLLNDNGVFYFWQVASWSRSDIDVIDERLDAFRGRISRDDWVSQAKRLRQSPDAAAMPADA